MTRPSVTRYSTKTYKKFKKIKIGTNLDHKIFNKDLPKIINFDLLEKLDERGQKLINERRDENRRAEK